VYCAVLSNFFKTRICAVLGLFVGRPSALVRLFGKLNSKIGIYKNRIYFYEIENKNTNVIRANEPTFVL
jgi:hypothetical protein